jgi:hypothetical protein
VTGFSRAWGPEGDAVTERDWLACDDHSAMLAFLHRKRVGSHRKYRLLLVAYCRTFLPVLLADERTRRAVEAAEAYADEAVARAELARAKRAALKAVEGQPRLDLAVRGVTHGLPEREVVEFPYFCLRPWRASNYNRPTPAQRRRLGQLIRDIFGNPFHPVSVNPGWLSWKGGTIAKLAASIYAGRAFDRLPVLVDALEEAGCSDAGVLAHLRGTGPHVRGCWPLDLILGKG